MNVAARIATRVPTAPGDERGCTRTLPARRPSAGIRRCATLAIVTSGLAAIAVGHTETGGYTLSAATTNSGGNIASGGAFTIESSVAEPLAESGLVGGAYGLDSGFRSLDDDSVFASGFE